jgi:hypothetical protein
MPVTKQLDHALSKYGNNLVALASFVTGFVGQETVNGIDRLVESLQVHNSTAMIFKDGIDAGNLRVTPVRLLSQSPDGASNKGGEETSSHFDQFD